MIRIGSCASVARTLLLAGGMVFGLSTLPAHATTYTVDSTTDAPATGSAPRTAAGRTVTCELGTVAEGNSLSAEFTVFASAGKGSLTVSADVSSGKTDPDTSNNSVNSTVSLLGRGRTTRHGRR